MLYDKECILHTHTPKRLTSAKPQPEPRMRHRLAVELNDDASHVFITDVKDYFEITVG